MLKSRSALEMYVAQARAGGAPVGADRAQAGPDGRRAEPVITGADAGIDGADGRRALRLGEISDTRLVHIGVYPGGAERFTAAAASVLGRPLPDSPLHASAAGDHLIMRIAPEQYWVLGGAAGLDARLRSAIPTDAGSVTQLDSARTRLLIEGPGARGFLGRLVPIDLDPTVFPTLAFAQTGIHHVAGLLFRASENRYELLTLRTFAAFTWEVLLDAARPFGYDIVLPEV